MSDNEIDQMPATNVELERASLVENWGEDDVPDPNCTHHFVLVEECVDCGLAQTVAEEPEPVLDMLTRGGHWRI